MGDVDCIRCPKVNRIVSRSPIGRSEESILTEDLYQSCKFVTTWIELVDEDIRMAVYSG